MSVAKIVERLPLSITDERLPLSITDERLPLSITDVIYFVAKPSTVDISPAFTPLPCHVYGSGHTAPERGLYGCGPTRTYAQSSTYTSLTNTGKCLG